MSACALDAAYTPVSNHLRTQLAAGAMEQQRLTQFMRSVAWAYDDVDEETVIALNNGGEGPVSPEGLTNNTPRPVALCDTATVRSAEPPNLIELEETRTILDKPDQAGSFTAFAEAWNKYNLTIQEPLGRFREFEDREGEEATAIQATFDQHRDRLHRMAQWSVTLAKQALDLARTHDWPSFTRRRHNYSGACLGRRRNRHLPQREQRVL
ncbi:PPE domain-containing protein [Mycobacterium kansasii]|uniref:Uncharacterized protein n=3 Tax=Mycobacterium kansasii TaxID=1768 RepID=A0A1V3XIV7_MYCKA|nr:hypothetical protein [Mycobacterium kansasii]AGZ54085.1 hypothetical protein MKAN_07575 [Mycobacterium kansasii ATCC 12478]ARG57987.1 hypothetical protein B1T43_21520 [Mycobacterium kansasii]ARG63504.1 hypothetical protein B1T45_22020 [Mycobacterium kansasii]ARG71142.1 hypothetical protein B1T47_21330 [Mycobacterium kansasii]ARG74337.1 hypothetical protein B1T51_07350 [Mycobacterium kansasii]